MYHFKKLLSLLTWNRYSVSTTNFSFKGGFCCGLLSIAMEEYGKWDKEQYAAAAIELGKPHLLCVTLH